ncbi:MAG: aspartate-semialdehyde dehydrogenase [Aigarchaeota archaeon]|nr:aspartate-semialdehyde dehydrogenase [Aigarchaeota archaeon]MDW8092266.1 aspartate-semialdehyde dehydrogenase [Nitrososphaerota archaeon]
MGKLKAAVLGATGMVGQIYLQLLSRHPWFELSAVTGKSNVGKKLVEAYRGKGWVPPEYADIEVLPTDPSKVDADVVFSSLPTPVAREVEPKFAEAGLPVVSDASAYRMAPDVPLIVPEINEDHLALIELQKRNRRWDGYIVTTPNCTTVGLVMPLKALHDAFTLRYVNAVSMQAVSGAGYAGVPSIAIMGNIIPYIDGEERKVIEEPRKILGTLKDGNIIPAEVSIDATCTRVPTLYGHLISVTAELERDFTIDRVVDSFSSFKGKPQLLELPTAPSRPIVVLTEDDRPQPRIDVEVGDVKGMSVSVGRIRKGVNERTLLFVTLSHNLIRGAAGIAILTAELLKVGGWLD